MDQPFDVPDKSEDRFNADPELSYTMAARLYTDPGVLEIERREVFYKSWICIGHASELADPGAYVTADILGQNVFAIRGRDRVLRAFYNVCQHRGHELLKGRGRAKNIITCPYHAWAYDYDGTLQVARLCEDVRGFSKADFTLPGIRIEELCGFVFVNLDPYCAPMAQTYAGLEAELERFCPNAAELEPAQTVVFDIAANWKNVGDNLLECYHCAPSHRDFVDLVEMGTYEVVTHDNWSSQYGRCRPSNSAYPFEARDGSWAKDGFSTIYMWPMFAFTTFPGTDGIAAFSALPTQAEVTHQEFTYYSPDGKMTQTETALMDYFRNVLGPEDVALVESVQKGLSSRGYHQGRFVIDKARTHTSEHAVHHFHSLVARALEGEAA
jgi:choline monooxygenase